MSLPRIVFIYEVKDTDGSKYLVAAASPQEAVDDLNGEARLIGGYKMFNKRTVRKVVTVKVDKEVLVR